MHHLKFSVLSIFYQNSFVKHFFIKLIKINLEKLIKTIYTRIMKTYQEMLRDILSSTGWSQQQLAIRLGISFPTVNYWLNNKVTPRKSMQKRIRDLYLARNIPYEGPVYITLQLTDITTPVKIGEEILLFKTGESDDDTSDYGVIGVRREDFTTDAPNPTPDDYNIAISVATTKDTVAKGTKPAFRIYDRIYPGAFARIMFILHDSAIAVVEDFGLKI